MNWLDPTVKQDYFNLINSGSVPEVKVNKKTGVCYGYNSLIGGHVHHITPRSEGGTNDPLNLVDLSYQDHLKAHYLLSKGIKTNEARHSYRCMIMFQGDWEEEPELTDEMAEEYAIACAKFREIMLKPVAIFKGYLHPETYQVFSSQSECADALGVQIADVSYQYRRASMGIEEKYKPRPASMSYASLKGWIVVDPDCEWTKDYLRLGHAPHINPKLVRGLGNYREAL
jgi:hypothetical protein